MIKPAVTFALLAMAACATSLTTSYDARRWSTQQSSQGPTDFEGSTLENIRLIQSNIAQSKPTMADLTDGLKKAISERPLLKPRDCDWIESTLCISNCKELDRSAEQTCEICLDRMLSICMSVQDDYASLVDAEINKLLTELVDLEESLNEAESKRKKEEWEVKNCEATKHLKAELDSVKRTIKEIETELITESEELKKLKVKHAKEIQSLDLETKKCDEKLIDASEAQTSTVAEEKFFENNLRECEEWEKDLTIHFQAVKKKLDNANRELDECQGLTNPTIENQHNPNSPVSGICDQIKKLEEMIQALKLQNKCA